MDFLSEYEEFFLLGLNGKGLKTRADASRRG